VLTQNTVFIVKEINTCEHRCTL